MILDRDLKTAPYIVSISIVGKIGVFQTYIDFCVEMNQPVYPIGLDTVLEKNGKFGFDDENSAILFKLTYG